MRAALGNRPLVRIASAYLACSVVEWAQFYAALVYAFDVGGPRAAGLATLALLVPFAVAAPWAGTLTDRCRPHRVRLWSAVVQMLAFGAAAGAAAAAAPVVVVVSCSAIGVAAITFQRPANAVLTPSIVRTPRELSVANVWLGWGESLGALFGPLMATLLMMAEGPSLVLGGCALLAGLMAMSMVADVRSDGPVPVKRPDDKRIGGVRSVYRSVSALRRRPGATGVLVVASAQFLLLGSFDLMLVVLAIDALDLADSAPGWLGTCVGLGALISTGVSATLVRRARLGPVLAISLATIAGAMMLLALVPSLAITLLVLPAVGLTRAMLNVTSRMLLQRASPPEALGSVFAALELFGGVGMTIGALAAQALIELGGAPLALGCFAAMFAVVLAGTWRSLQVVDEGADIPVVAISLLRRLPMFAPMPPLPMEAVARAATEMTVPSGRVVIAEGEHADRFYAIVDGSFDVSIDGRHIRTFRRGDGFGEVALLADVARTATVTAATAGALLAIERAPFLTAITGTESSHRAALQTVEQLHIPPDDDPTPTNFGT